MAREKAGEAYGLGEPKEARTREAERGVVVWRNWVGRSF